MKMACPPANGPRQSPWTAPPDAVATAFATDPVRGLDESDARHRRHDVGPNDLPTGSPPTRRQLVAHQFTNTMTALLCVAAAVTVAIGDTVDAAAIAAIVVVNGLIGYVQDQRAQEAITALRTMTTPMAQVVRSGERTTVVTTEVVPGDLVVLAVGDVVPADLRLTEVHDLSVDESTLTGESEPVTKVTSVLADPLAPVADRSNLAFRGTAVTAGRGSGIVVATGAATELGQIASLLVDAPDTATPLQRRLDLLGRQLAATAIALCAVLFVIGTLRGEPSDTMFLSAVTLAVAAVPEGLPAVVTVALAIGARRMANRRGVVRHLPAVETLGSVTVIATDKTGTLTQNRMSVEEVWTPSGRYRVSGVGYAPVGDVTGPHPAGQDAELAAVAEVAAACNDAQLHRPDASDGAWGVTGDPTEAALLALAGRLGVDPTSGASQNPRVAEVPFEAETRRMITVHQGSDGAWVAAKGALGALAPSLHADDAPRLAAARTVADELAADGYRVLALAERHLDTVPGPGELVVTGLRLVGLVGIADPLRPGAADAIAACRTAGIAPVMITGDHPKTAVAIARRLGLHGSGRVVTGKEVEAMGTDELQAVVPEVAVFARTDPAQKLRIVKAWQASGAVVAMTGDGVNDAPALHQADIGVAMGQTGTDVSREAADLVLTDDDVATIVAAVEEGRRIHDNIRRCVRYLLSTNSGEVGLMILAPLLGLPLPLLPLQILWINLVTDGLPAVALGLEPVEADAMTRPPRPPEESILARGLWQQSLGIGALLVAVTLPLLVGARAADWPWQTMVFTTLGLAQLGTALALRSRSGPRRTWLVGAVGLSALLQLVTVTVSGCRRIFDTEALAPVELLVAVALATVPFLVIELVRWSRGPL